MGKDSGIEWTHHTFNPWSGCEKVSAGCAHCYAAALPPGMRRHAEWGKDRPRVMASESYWIQPLAWNRAAEKAGERHRVFCASVADVFEAREGLDGARSRLFDLVYETPHLDWLLLTKRPEYAVAWWGRQTGQAWPGNAWIGTSVENQAAADERIPHLLRIPARVRFLSCEPLLGAVDLTSVAWPTTGDPRHRVDVLRGGYWSAQGWRACGPAAQLGEPRGGFTNHSDMPGRETGMISWVIVGGESGRHARPMHPDWARSLRDQCVGAGVAYFFKQFGEYIAEPGGVEEGDYVFPDGLHMVRVGKAAAGRLIDGREWSEVPRGQ